MGLIWQTTLLIIAIFSAPVAMSSVAYKVGIEADDFVRAPFLIRFLNALGLRLNTSITQASMTFLKLLS